jgi:3-deoxy-D-manno-octulosonic-acid transferase
MPLGGQNLIEALAVGTPVVAGPSMFNFAEATRLAVAGGAALQCGSAAEAAGAARELLSDGPRRAAMGEAGKRFCAAHRGATRRHLEALAQVLRARARG